MSGPEVLIDNYVYEHTILEIIISTSSDLTACADFKGLTMTKVIIKMRLIVRNAENKACCNELSV